jgi:hypothetical protein
VSQYQPSDIRISDVEREDALAKLGEHMAAGRLDIDEYGERSAKVATAKTRGELLGLFGDLPEPKPVFGQPKSLAAPRERTFVDKYVHVAAPFAVIALVAGVFIAFKLPFFLPFLFLFLFINHRRGPGNRWQGGGGRSRGMRHGRG